MKNCALFLGILVPWLSIVSYCEGVPTLPATNVDDLKECKFWHELGKNLSSASQMSGDMLHMSCNSTCTSIDCTGHFKQANILFGNGVDLSFCCGLRLNHCTDPVSLDYYLDVPQQGLKHSDRIEHNDTYNLPGPSILGQQSVVEIMFELVTINSSYVLFGVDGNLKVMSDGIAMFPLKKEKIFPATLIDIPPCTTVSNSMAPYTGPNKCIPVKAGKDNSTKTKIVINSDTYNTSCELGVTICSQFETCLVMTDNGRKRSGLCMCNFTSVFNTASGYCEASRINLPIFGSTLMPTGIPSVTVAHTKDNTKPAANAGMNKTGIIIGCVAGGLLLIVVIVSVIIFIGRRKKTAIYRDRHQLLTDDIDDNDSSLVI